MRELGNQSMEHMCCDGSHNARRLMKRGLRRSLAAVMTLCMALTGCQLSGRHQEPSYEPPEEVSSAPVEEEPIGMSAEDAAYAALEYIESMSLEEKIGQLFIVNLELLDTSKGNFYEHKRITKQMKESLQKFPVGGVIFFSRNIEKRKQTRKLINRLQKNSDIPLFVTVDEEGGDVARIGANEKMKTETFPTMEEIGRTQDEDYVYQMASTIGREIGELGFNVDFAPVADVRTSELNQEIGTRSFGDDPDKVSGMVDAYVRGLESQNIYQTPYLQQIRSANYSIR